LDILTTIQTVIGEVLKLPPAAISPEALFHELSISPIQAANIEVTLENQLGLTPGILELERFGRVGELLNHIADLCNA